MKSILMFFFLVFIALGAGVYFYEMQIASPNAADALVKSKKKQKLNKEVVKAPPTVKKSSLSVVGIKDTIVSPIRQSRVVDLLVLKGVGRDATKAGKDKQREIDQSIRSTIKKSISLEIQKAVVTEISKKR